MVKFRVVSFGLTVNHDGDMAFIYLFLVKVYTWLYS